MSATTAISDARLTERAACAPSLWKRALPWLAPWAVSVVVRFAYTASAHPEAYAQGKLDWPPGIGGALLGVAGEVGLICAAAGIGSLVAILIKDRNILLPAGVFAAFADYFMVRY